MTTHVKPSPPITRPGQSPPGTREIPWGRLDWITLAIVMGCQGLVTWAVWMVWGRP